MKRLISMLLPGLLVAAAVVLAWTGLSQHSGEIKADEKKEPAGKEVNIVGVLKVREGTEKEMRDIFAALVEPSRKNDGNLRYELYQDQSDPRRFVFVQRWTNEASHQKHDQEAAHIQEFKKKHLEKVESAEIYQLTLVK
jgi:quinol monooxygenase YgiN